jgi:dihydrofolate reductase
MKHKEIVMDFDKALGVPVAMIAAQSKDRVIGVDNSLPWHLPADLKFFKTMTLGKPVVMGRKTFDSVGRPLPNRTNIVITRQEGWAAEGVKVVGSVAAALRLAAEERPEEIMIVGGEQIYREVLPLADRIYLTEVDIDVEGDAKFPELSAEEWDREVLEEHPIDDEGRPAFRFTRLNRVT